VYACKLILENLHALKNSEKLSSTEMVFNSRTEQIPTYDLYDLLVILKKYINNAQSHEHRTSEQLCSRG
jgi:hypothetical protein